LVWPAGPPAGGRWRFTRAPLLSLAASPAAWY